MGHTIDGVEHGEFVVQQLGLILCVVANLDIVPELEHTAVVNLRHDALDQRRLTFAVLADEGNFLTAADGEVDLRKDLMIAVVFLHVVANHGIIARTRAGRKLEM